MKVILCIIFVTVVILFGIPFKLMLSDWRISRGGDLFGRLFSAIFIFCIGFCVNPIIIVVMTSAAILWLLTCGCCCTPIGKLLPRDAEEAKKENEEKAKKAMKLKLGG